MTAMIFALHPAPAAPIDTIGVQPTPSVGAADTPTADAIGETLRRIVASETFRMSKRHRAFLAYLVEAALDGRAAALKEVVIGLEVFGRRIDGYDPDRDSIVRVEAKRLRTKLERYYATEGADDAVEIRLPVGRYVPHFVIRAARRAPLVLVLPFAAFTDGDRTGSSVLMDRLVEGLGALRSVRLVAPMVGTALRERPADFDAFVDARRVEYVVDGTIVSHGTRTRCIAHVSRLRDRLRLWSGRFDFGGDVAVDWLAIQDRVADAVATVMTQTIGDDPANR